MSISVFLFFVLDFLDIFASYVRLEVGNRLCAKFISGWKVVFGAVAGVHRRLKSQSVPRVNPRFCE